MNHVYLSLGSNRGNREDYLRKAIDLLGKTGSVTKVSSLYETQPWKMVDSTNFINQAVLLDTTLDAEHLMANIIHIEQSLGRVRGGKNYEPRTIDIDILFFNNDVVMSPNLTIPHPYIQERRFVLEPLAEIAPLYIHPILKKTVSQLLADCPDSLLASRLISE